METASGLQAGKPVQVLAANGLSYFGDVVSYDSAGLMLTNCNEDIEQSELSPDGDATAGSMFVPWATILAVLTDDYGDDGMSLSRRYEEHVKALNAGPGLGESVKVYTTDGDKLEGCVERHDSRGIALNIMRGQTTQLDTGRLRREYVMAFVPWSAVVSIQWTAVRFTDVQSIVAKAKKAS